MSVYNILFPFLIIFSLGIIVFVLTRHLPEAVEHETLVLEKEKRRWWQVILGKGEGFLRYLRLKILQLDEKLSESIKKVRKRKEAIAEEIKDQKVVGREENFVENQEIVSADSMEERMIEEIRNEKEEVEEEKENSEEAQINSEEEEIFEDKTLESAGVESIKIETKASKIKKGISEAFKIFKKGESSNFSEEEGVRIKPQPIKTRTFTPNEIKVEREYYLKKKEELLIQTIVNDPKNVGLYLQLGRVYYNQKNFQDAKNAFKEALKLDKTNVKAREELKRIEKIEG